MKPKRIGSVESLWFLLKEDKFYATITNMATYTGHFLAGLLLALFAFFDMPLPAVFDKWGLIALGLYLAYSSYRILAKEQSTRSVHDEKNA